MKKATTKILAAITALLTFMVWAVNTFADETPLPESAYKYQPTTEKSNFFSGVFPPVIFTAAFVMLLYGIYHFWSKGKIMDDMK
jgi:hypothetical protein